ncbi:hypothetical protein [Spirosoma aerolatum]|uniref:hypothetical protein n=1 Tax=Spirosoma aerolatum TaxID=1211326 RepID=UPI0009ABB2EF|nr:hypothetical protein [Spirosoma aerolatum]
MTGIPFEETLSHCVADAREGNQDGHTIMCAFGEITIAGVEYQMQIQLIADKRLWIGESDVVRSEVVKVHDPAPGYNANR